MAAWPLWQPGHYGSLATMAAWPLWQPGHYGSLATMAAWPLWPRPSAPLWCIMAIVHHCGALVSAHLVSAPLWCVSERSLS
jgi:hypothetical protein